MILKRVLIAVFILILVAVGGAYAEYVSLTASLPEITTMQDYKPLLVTEVFARGGEKIGEFSRENRTLVNYDKIPRKLINAFLAAEDNTFFEHGGVNYIAMARAFLVNLSSGQKKQGASTITQQLARALLLSSEKTYSRKIKEVLLSYKIEENLKKEQILYLYLNQIYFGQGAYGITAAADTYFHKPIDKITLGEMAILAGLPKAPTDYSPATNPKRAKERQRYVLSQMAKYNFVKKEEAEAAAKEPIKVFVGKESRSVGPYFVETVRLMLVDQLGEKAVLDEGLKVYTSLDYKAQQHAQEQVQEGLREVDKREGYRPPTKNLQGAKEIETFLITTRRNLESKQAAFRIILPEGNVQTERPLTIYHRNDIQGRIVSNVPDYISIGQIVDGIVTKVDDQRGIVVVRFGEAQGIIPLSEMTWARKPDPTVNALYAPKITRPSAAVKVGDLILVKVLAARFEAPAPPPPSKKKGAPPPKPVPTGYEDYAKLALEQEPLAEGALLSFDQKTGEVIAMVGGYEFKKNVNEFNRSILAKRQTGSAFKSIVYTSAIDKGYTPATPILDAPIVFDVKSESDEGQDDTKTWKPHNHGEKFGGDILVRTALARSLNIPAVKILEGVGVSWVIDYARRLGVFSPLNADLSLALGSSSLTLFEMTKVFSEIGRQGVRLRPVMIHRVLDKDGKEVAKDISLEERFQREMGPLDKEYEDKRKAFLQMQANQPEPAAADPAATPDNGRKKLPQIYFKDPEQLISPQTAYIMTTLLSAVINDPMGTAGAARALGRPAAGKTGSTNGYFDGWFVGFTPQIATGVWVGFDSEKTLGPGEVGGRTALPIWLEYMKSVHKDLPVASFPVPEGIVFANIDGMTGKLASASSTSVVNQAFIQGTEPKEISGSPQKDDQDFYKEDLNE